MTDEAWDIKREFNAALVGLPAVPSTVVLAFLMPAAMNSPGMNLWERGKQLQREHTGQIPFKTEYECAAGLWDLIRAGVLQSREHPSDLGGYKTQAEKNSALDKCVENTDGGILDR